MRVFRTAAFRLAAAYAVLFAASVAALGAVVYGAVHLALERRMDARIEAELSRLRQVFASGGLDRLVATIGARPQTRSAAPFEYLVVGSTGARLAGQLPAMPNHLGWTDLHYTESDGDEGRLRVLTAPLDGGVRLAVGESAEDVEEVEQAILDAFGAAFASALALGIFGGVALSFAFLRRVDSITRTAEAIIAGDLSQRVPTCGTQDDLDRLALTLNRMLDRISALMESVKQVSNDIAHDLRTPLSRLRQGLEAAQYHARSAADYETAVEAAMSQVDGILATFGALLRIAQIEARATRAGFRELDLSAVFDTIVEAFAPAAEDEGKRLTGRIEPGIRIDGDRELLTQMLANLVENAIRHTPEGTRIEVSLETRNGVPVGIVADHGPGVPEPERERMFERFYRLERSRSTPGSGLGLSLVRAIADLHGIGLVVADNRPGLRLVLSFRP